MKLKIGNVELKNNIILAPMAGVTTSSFRRICLEHNAGLVCTEMISDKGLQYENQKTLKMVEIKEDTLNMVALDGFRMAVAREYMKNEEKRNIIITSKIVRFAMKEIGLNLYSVRNLISTEEDLLNAENTRAEYLDNYKEFMLPNYILALKLR